MNSVLYLSPVRSSDLLGGIKLLTDVLSYCRYMDEPLPPMNCAADSVPIATANDKGIGLSVRNKLLGRYRGTKNTTQFGETHSR